MNLYTRSEWGAAPYRGIASPLGVVRRIVVHHSAGPRPETETEAAALVRGIQDYHQNDPKRQYDDIGYHYLIGAGRVFEGRQATANGLALGGHIGGRNTGSVGVCVLGHFERDCPTAVELDTLRLFLRELLTTYGLDRSAIQGHRDLRDSLCPGAHLYAVLETMRAAVD